MRDTFSFLPWIQVDTPKISAFDPSLNTSSFDYKGKYQYQYIEEYEVYEYDISNEGDIIFPFLAVNMTNDDFKHAYPTLNSVAELRIRGENAPYGGTHAIKYQFTVPTGSDPDNPDIRTNQDTFWGGYNGADDASLKNLIVPINLLSNKDATPTRIVAEQYVSDVSYSNVLLGDDQLGVTSLSLDQADEPILQFDGSKDDWSSDNPYYTVTQILLYKDYANPNEDDKRSWRYGHCPSFNSSNWQPGGRAWRYRWLPNTEPTMIDLVESGNGLDLYNYYYDTPNLNTQESDWTKYGCMINNVGCFKYVGASKTIRLKRLVGYKKCITYTEPKYNITLESIHLNSVQ